jgi:beta-lactamase class A
MGERWGNGARLQGLKSVIGLAAMLLAIRMPMAGQKAGCGPAKVDESLVYRLQTMVEERAKAGRGRTALFAWKLNDGSSVGVNEDVPVQTASAIKLGILYEAMVQVREGKARWDEPIMLKKGDAVPGSGILTLLDAPLTITLKDALTLMVVVSDNTATNLMIDRFGIDNVNARMESLWLKNTHLYKKVFKPAVGAMPADQPKFGLGKTTAREMATLMTYIGECKLHVGGWAGSAAEIPYFLAVDEQDAAVCGVALDMLKHQFSRETIPRYLETADATTNGVAIASKTGSLDAVRNDVAIVSGKDGPMVLAIFTYENADHGWTVDNEGEVEIAKLAKAIVAAWSPQGLDGRLLVPGLGLSKDRKGCDVVGAR